MAERVSEWITTFDTVFPNQVNPLGTLFGGRVLELMDINAAIACWRFCRLPSVTASTEPVDFRTPIYVGEIIELRSRVASTGRTSMIVRCEVFGESPTNGERRQRRTRTIFNGNSNSPSRWLVPGGTKKPWKPV